MKRIFGIVLFVFLFSGCVYDIKPTLTYIPPIEKPRSFYKYEDFWYSEPYIVFTFEDPSGNRSKKKVPISKLKRHIRKNKLDSDSIIRDVEKMKRHQMFNYKIMRCYSNDCMICSKKKDV